MLKIKHVLRQKHIAIRARTVSEGSWVRVCGVCVGKFELVRFVFWVALHPEEVDWIPLIWVVICFSLVCGSPQVMSPTFTT
jgi:hypothetical protein